MSLQINAKLTQINIIQVSASTTYHEDEEVQEFYSQIIEILNELQKQNLMIIIGDFNAKVGTGCEENCIDPWGKKWKQLRIFEGVKEFVVANTSFLLPPRRLYTWKSLTDSPENIIRSQIDYILVNKIFRHSCTLVKTYKSTDLQSDHIPLIGVFKVRLKRVGKKIIKLYDLQKLKEPLTRQ